MQTAFEVWLDGALELYNPLQPSCMAWKGRYHWQLLIWNQPVPGVVHG